MRVLGAVLAGGRSQRFGSDKALATWRGVALIDHAIAALVPVTDGILVCGREWPGRASVSDRPHADLGPLGGLAAALAYGESHGFDRVLCLPCDTPVVPPALLQRLLDQARPVYVEAMPVIGCWPTALGDALDRHLAGDGTRSLRGWAAATTAAEPVALRDGEALVNVNRPGDLAALAD